jgi:hypothetical protein
LGSQKTYRGEDCAGPCHFYNEDYYYCRTASSWDYCSLAEPYDEVLSPLAEEISFIDCRELPSVGKKCRKGSGYNFLVANQHPSFSRYFTEALKKNREWIHEK